MDVGPCTFVFTFTLRQKGIMTTKTEEKDCDDWTDAHFYFVERARILGVQAEGLSSCSFSKKDKPESACRFGGISLEEPC